MELDVEMKIKVESNETAIEYKNGKTTFVANCKGYPFEKNTGFNENMIIEV